jgi:hypothetical protein
VFWADLPADSRLLVGEKWVEPNKTFACKHWVAAIIHHAVYSGLGPLAIILRINPGNQRCKQTKTRPWVVKT